FRAASVAPRYSAATEALDSGQYQHLGSAPHSRLSPHPGVACLRYAFLRSWLLSGSERMRLPVAAKMALHKAGATTATGGSPTPSKAPSLGTMTVSTCGISARRNIG